MLTNFFGIWFVMFLHLLFKVKESIQTMGHIQRWKGGRTRGQRNSMNDNRKQRAQIVWFGLLCFFCWFGMFLHLLFKAKESIQTMGH